MNRRQALQACGLLPFFDQTLVDRGQLSWGLTPRERRYSIEYSYSGVLTIRGPGRSVSVSLEEIMDALEQKP